MVRRGRALSIVAALVLAACGSPSLPASTPLAANASPAATARASSEPSPSVATPSVATPSTGQGQGQVGGVYAATVSGRISPQLAEIPQRVYVPDEGSGDVVIIDPRTFAIVGRVQVGKSPEHVTPDWDLDRLYVNEMDSNALTVLDPKTGKAVKTIQVPHPYNLYFTVEGTKAIVVEDSGEGGIQAGNGLRFYDRRTWRLLGSVSIPYPGADHLDFSADGRYLFLSCEYSGVVVKVDTRTMKVAGFVRVGGLPIDVRLAPAGDVVYVANQGSNGVSIVDPMAMKVVGFIKTGKGAHGLALSRDTSRLLVTNRLAGTVSVISIASRRVVATWEVGGSPDMMALAPDGHQLWISNRYSGTVSVVDTRTGAVLKVIATGDGPHGLSYWPQPGRFSLGHNGNMR